ncbi:MAG: hypothetical protein R2761_21585 [Acidimicrobiales bacterium]
MRPGPRIAHPTRQSLLAALVVAVGLAALAGPVVVLTGAARGRAQPSGDPFGAGLGADGRLSAATLDVEAGQRTAPVTVGALAPGDRATGSIEIVNAGDLPLHYALLLSPTGQPVESWLRWDLWLGPARGCGGGTPGPTDPDLLLSGAVLDGGGPIALLGRPDPGFDPGDRVLGVGQRELLCLAVFLPLDAPDAVQGQAVTPRFVAAAEHHLPGAGPGSEAAPDGGSGT